jgi:hypothetical protein
MGRKNIKLCFLALSIVCYNIVAADVFCQNIEETRVVQLQGGKIKISLSADWQRKGQDKLSQSTIFMRKTPNAIIAIDIYPLKDIPSVACNDRSYQLRYLQGVKNSLEEKGVEFTEDVSYFGAPTLIVNSENKEKTKKSRDIHFLKDCKYYIVTFVCDKDYFEAQWHDVEPKIKSMEFGE